MKNRLLIQLQKAVEIENEISIRENIQKIGETKVIEAVPYLISLLEDTTNCKLRNLIALALADIGCQKALKPLVYLVKSKKTEGCRGTLIHALGFLDCSPVLSDLVNLVIFGGFEVSCEALFAIESIKSIKHSCLTKDIQYSRQQVKIAINNTSSSEQDRIERLKLLKSILE